MNADKLNNLIAAELEKANTYSVLLGIQSKNGEVEFLGAVQREPGQLPGTNQSTVPYEQRYNAYAAGISPTQPYFIASVTKMYTAAIIMQLVDEGSVDLAAPISTYLPAELIGGIHVYQGTDYSQRITVQQLVRQTSGLADYFEDKRADGRSLLDDLKQNMDCAYTVADVLAQVRTMSPHFAPDADNGQKAHYSDTNYQLLGAIIEAVTDQALAEAYQTRIFDRLGFTATYLYDHQNLPAGPQPLPMYYQDQVLNLPLARSSERGAGGIVATVPESLRFLRAYFAGELFDPAHLPRLMERWNMVFFPVQYGGGLMRVKLPRLMTLFQYTPELIGHAGSIGSFAFFAPKEELFVAGTFNQAAKPGRPVGFMIKAIKAAQR